MPPPITSTSVSLSPLSIEKPFPGPALRQTDVVSMESLLSS
jgi:hypothetical protein